MVDRRRLLLVVAVLVAALGAGLVFLYAQDAEERAAEDVQTTQVLVALQPILPGESSANLYRDGKVDLRDVPNDQLLDGATDDGTAFDQAVALTTIYPGEQLLTQKFGTIQDIEGRPTLPIPAGKGAVTFELTQEDKVGSFAQPGSHVAVYVTTAVDDSQLSDEQRADLEQQSAILVQPSCLYEDDLLVLGVGSTSVSSTPPADGSDQGGEFAQGEVVGTTLMTVAVDSQQAAGLIGLRDAAGQDGDAEIQLRFVLRTDESQLKPTSACVDQLQPYLDQLELAGGNGGDGDGGDSDEANS